MCVCVCACRDREPCKTAEPIKMRFGADSRGLREACIGCIAHLCEGCDAAPRYSYCSNWLKSNNLQETRKRAYTIYFRQVRKKHALLKSIAFLYSNSVVGFLLSFCTYFKENFAKREGEKTKSYVFCRTEYYGIKVPKLLTLCVNRTAFVIFTKHFTPTYLGSLGGGLAPPPSR